MRIAVAGIGYVGLSNALLLARHNDVTALDTDARKVERLNRRKCPVEDAEASAFLAEQCHSLRATADPEEAFRRAGMVLVATPTDFCPARNRFDTSSVESVIEQALAVSPRATIVIKSTVPIGFTDAMRQKYPDGSILFSPEFLREGRALRDALFPSRVIVGVPASDTKQRARAERFAALCRQGAKKRNIPALFMPPSEAEAVKFFANAYLAMRVAFFNELDTFSDALALDPAAIIEGVGLDPRIGAQYRNPSFGFGGYCLPKDLRQLVSAIGSAPCVLIPSVIEANRTRKRHVAGQILRKAGYPQRTDPVVGIYRLIMKAGADNFRHAAVLDVMDHLRQAGVRTVIYEPLLPENPFRGARVLRSFDEFAQISDVIVANRFHAELAPFQQKVYTRDLFHRD